MIRIRDPLHGTVQLTALEEKLLDSPAMQRLRGIRQLAMAYLVYPGANHARFEHSIGTLFLADRICRELGVPQEKAAKVRLAALLHDIGHVAFSHEAEAVLQEHIGNHEEVGKRLMLEGEIAEILGKEYSPKEIVSVYSSPLGEIITSDLGADRMDCPASLKRLISLRLIVSTTTTSCVGLFSRKARRPSGEICRRAACDP